MTWFVESPWPAVVIGLTAEAILAVLLVRTRRGNIVGGMIAVATATVGLVAVERLVVTDNEEIEQLFGELTRAFKANDEQRLLDLFTTDSPRANELRNILPHVRVRHAKIDDLDIQVNQSSVPTSATATITERVEARDDRESASYEHITRKLKVTLHKEGGHWLVYNYSETEPAKSSTGSP